MPRKGCDGPGAGGRPGFTLIELLILIGVFTLMAVAAVPAYSYFSRGEDGQGPLVSRPTALMADAELQAAELLTVQMAMDGMMAISQIVEVEPSPMHGTDSFEALPSGAGAEPLFPGFLFTVAEGSISTGAAPASQRAFRLSQDCSGFDGLRLYVDQHGTSLSVYLPLTG